MSVASSIPYIKIPNPSSSCSSPSSSSSATSTSSSFRFATTVKPCALTIRSSQADGPIRRPVAPPLREPSPPSSPPSPLKPVPPSSPVAPPPPKPASQVVLEDKNAITLEFQRQKAKELQDYFKQKKLEEAAQGPFFGFVGKNEIANGRWAMFGFAVGLLTEYATGSDFVDQVKILLSNFGILDLE
ncbi:light-harvesting complex-like protein OHP2, chloroplastic [Ricinus communis]|uniref:Light-harvesting complex-like protein OHP2, chloroplastic n=1 Tax=Ricinus communis TaxID=3988 RepID=B9SEA9_RICCO|nr:light-harvesting complex-like protein OHP2, chloroplastic [Ricinus communis]EEF38068.1 conserved hypothetical protein [Ricinus communis]|eukprot:XP_002524328.1 light-harvesting complex-like protein OHP2, chloroplastic [Ricinus communis]